MAEQVVHLVTVEAAGDDVWATGEVEGLLDEEGNRKRYTAHAWQTHLVTLKDDEERRRYLAAEVLKVAAPDLPRDTLPLSGKVALSREQVVQVFAPPAKEEP
jgi:hypothetical protein